MKTLLILIFTASLAIGQMFAQNVAIDKYAQSFEGFSNLRYIVKMNMVEDNHIYTECFEIPKAIWDIVSLGQELNVDGYKKIDCIIKNVIER